MKKFIIPLLLIVLMLSGCTAGKSFSIDQADFINIYYTGANGEVYLETLDQQEKKKITDMLLEIPFDQLSYESSDTYGIGLTPPDIYISFVSQKEKQTAYFGFEFSSKFRVMVQINSERRYYYMDPDSDIFNYVRKLGCDYLGFDQLYFAANPRLLVEEEINGLAMARAELNDPFYSYINAAPSLSPFLDLTEQLYGKRYYTAMGDSYLNIIGQQLGLNEKMPEITLYDYLLSVNSKPDINDSFSISNVTFKLISLAETHIFLISIEVN